MLQIIAGAMSIAGGIIGSRDAKKNARRKAQMIRKMSDYNARVNEMEARSVEQSMRAETSRSYKQKRRALAEQRATYAKAGANLSGTSMEVLLDQAQEMEFDIQNERRNRLLQSQALRQGAKTTRYEGKLEASAAMSEGKALARQTLFSGISQGIGQIGSGITSKSTSGTTEAGG
jgi:hypothetical protein